MYPVVEGATSDRQRARGGYLLNCAQVSTARGVREYERVGARVRVRVRCVLLLRGGHADAETDTRRHSVLHCHEFAMIALQRIFQLR